MRLGVAVRFDGFRLVGVEQELDRSDLEEILRPEFRFRHILGIEPRAVRGFEIAEQVAVPVPDDAAVMTGNRRIIDRNRIILAATDGDGVAVDRKRFAFHVSRHTD